jgi:hypothetical protein
MLFPRHNSQRNSAIPRSAQELAFAVVAKDSEEMINSGLQALRGRIRGARGISGSGCMKRIGAPAPNETPRISNCSTRIVARSNPRVHSLDLVAPRG